MREAFKASALPSPKGVYRIVYEIRDDVLIVVVAKVGHRKRVYKEG
jgi:mRNA interferase RelE/StbE